MRVKAFCCWSGGKESALSLYRAKNEGIEITYLLNMLSEDGEYSRSHRIRKDCLRGQSEAIRIPIIQRKTSWENYEREFKSAVLELKENGLEAGVFGDVDLQEHRDWVERVCKDLGVKPILPLWKEKREKIIKDFIEANFKAIVIVTQANLLGKEWLGKKIDEEFIDNLKSLTNVDLCGEKGEYHTFVYDGPIFEKQVKFAVGKSVFKDEHWFLEVLKDQ
ncbi:MAG: ATP pyrophosphatase [Armatimonadetes bacterium CG07_land_8_20_14_0_80_40_9]|nr:MAG: ATP pyrophosphatase [Armatimonadetes bacterium CG07_land_8_20_14_0_80_40_9]